MKKKSTYGLKPEQLERLLSIGSEGEKSKGTTSENKEGQANVPLSKHQNQPQIEGYEIIGELGEAGQGQVWRALQLSTNRQVALKVPRTGLISSEKALARFEREVELAASLKHPNIAQIHDSGIHHGIYYYAMDLIEGTQLDEYVKQHNLTIRQVLELMRTICRAVQHAHQNGVIHRDLKPSNVIVTEDGRPYIVDFGLAKNLFEDDLSVTISIDGEAAGTPAYMSPEQAAGHIDQMDTRTDVYSLGVILFTLLTGESPHDLSGSRIEVLRRIAEESVKRPRKIFPEIDKDLELLLLKSLDNEPDRRYMTAGDMARDIDNYLQGAPLIAGPESRLYHIKKFVRRHKAFVTGVAAVAIVLIGGIIASVLFAVRAEHARAEAQAVSGFLRNSVLASLDPYKVGGREITIRSVLDTASNSLEGEFKGMPLAKAEIYDTLGNAYWSLGLYKLAESHLKPALDIQQAQRGIEDPTTLASMHQLGWVYFAQSRYSEAERFISQAYRIRDRLWGEEHPDTVYSMMGLACVYNIQGRLQEAEQLARKGLEITCRVLDREHWYVSGFMNILAWNYEIQGRYTDAEQWVENGLRIAQRTLDENHWFTLLLKQTLSRICMAMGRYDEAERHLLDTLDSRREAWGPEHPDTLETMAYLGRLYHSQGRYEQAESYLKQAMETARRVVGEEQSYYLYSMHGLGTLYLTQGRYDEAEPLLTKVLEIERRVMGEENRTTLQVTNTLAKLYTAQGRYKEAEKTFHQTLEARKNKFGEEHPSTLESKNDLSMLYKEQARYDEAESLLLEAVEGRVQKLGQKHPHTKESINNLIELYEAWNKPEKAEQWREKLSAIDPVR